MLVPGLDDYDELILADSMNIDSVSWKGARLRGHFGAGYGAFAVVGPPSGLHRFTLSAGVLPADDDYGNLVNNTNRFDYYFEFFKDHVTGDQEVFWTTFRDKKYHFAFVENDIDFERFSEDLFGGGVEIEQRKVPGVYYRSDGSIFDPAEISEIWGRYVEDEPDVDRSGNGHDLGITGNVDEDGGTAQNGRKTARFNGGGTNTGYLNTTLDPKIYEAFFVIKINEATFSVFEGILTADTTTAALVGNSGDTKLVNFTFGGTYSYKLNGVTLTEATQNAPMNTFGVIHARWSNGITLTNMQIGKDRDFAGRFLEADIGEIVLCDAVLSTADSSDMDGFLIRAWNIN